MQFHYLFKDLPSSIENRNENVNKIKITGRFRLTTMCVCETFRVSLQTDCLAGSLNITAKLADAAEAKGLSKIL